ncbi:acyl-CoA thioesterase [Nocardia sp. NBC_01503]|uniref:acyl-CoA thioesterase n=1 Tax=Nocardia sp. NBC_01503 TaxID=2975997 RepID=UPI002E7BD604|nr:thioesterase family protein [Nocardia sp. NBC_01503]WTL32201.1 acyl-CoA thioesterase [Nocardia sp. NBC_01503]
MARHQFLCPLRWSDMDADGHVHNAEHLRYLEETRIDVFRERGFRGSCVVAQMDIDYLTPLRYRSEPVRVETWVTKVGSSSFTLTQEIRDDDIVYSAATCTMVAFDREAQRSRKLDDAERRMLEELSA